VLGADVFVVKTLSFLIGQRHHFSCTVGKTFEHRYFLMIARLPGGNIQAFICRLLPQLFHFHYNFYSFLIHFLITL
jgi:hypothetical protein